MENNFRPITRSIGKQNEQEGTPTKNPIVEQTDQLTLTVSTAQNQGGENNMTQWIQEWTNNLTDTLERKIAKQFKIQSDDMNTKWDEQKKHNEEINTKLDQQSKVINKKLDQQKEVMNTRLDQQSDEMNTKFDEQKEQNKQINTKLDHQSKQISIKLEEQGKQLNDIVNTQLEEQKQNAQRNIKLDEVTEHLNSLQLITDKLRETTNTKVKECHARTKEIADEIATVHMSEIQQNNKIKFWTEKTETLQGAVNDLTDENKKLAEQMAAHKVSMEVCKATIIQKELDIQAVRAEIEDVRATANNKLDLITKELGKVVEWTETHPDRPNQMLEDDYYDDTRSHESTFRYLERCRPLQTQNNVWPTLDLRENHVDTHHQTNYGTHNPNSQPNFNRQEAFDHDQDRKLTNFLHRESVPVFDGDNISAPKFLEDLESFFRSFGITNDKVKLKSVPNYLLQNAQEWFRISSKEIFSWEQFKEAFMNQYFGPLEQQRLEDEWNDLVCLPHYDIERFVLKAINTQHLIKPHEPLNKRCHNIIRKLPSELRDFLALQQYNTYNNFLLAVKEGMRYKGLYNNQNPQTSQRYTNIYNRSSYNTRQPYRYRPQNGRFFNKYNSRAHNYNSYQNRNYSRQNYDNYNQNPGYNNNTRNPNNTANQNNYGQNNGYTNNNYAWNNYNNNNNQRAQQDPNNQQTRRPWYRNRNMGYVRRRRFRGRRPQRRNYHNNNQGDSGNSWSQHPNGQPNNYNVSYMGQMQQGNLPQPPQGNPTSQAPQNTNTGTAAVPTNATGSSN